MIKYFVVLLQITKEETHIPLDEYSPNSLKLEEEEYAPITTEKVLPSTLKNLSPSLIVAGVMGNLEPVEKVAESEPMTGRYLTLYRSRMSRRIEIKKRIKEKTKLKNSYSGRENVEETGVGEEEVVVQIINSPTKFMFKASLSRCHSESPTAVNILETSPSSLYDKFTLCKSQTIMEMPPKDQLNCDNHPFFMDCLSISE